MISSKTPNTVNILVKLKKLYCMNNNLTALDNFEPTLENINNKII